MRCPGEHLGVEPRLNRPSQHRFLPHTERDRAEMLRSIGGGTVEELFQAIPAAIRNRSFELPPPLSEAELLDEMGRFAGANRTGAKLFLGAGAYEHFIPSMVWSLAGRGEFATAYTPYQPEVSQGTLQAAFEYQSLICELLAMEVSNSSLYDGASALAEAALMANRIVRKDRVLAPATLHPAYRQVLQTYLQGIGVAVETIPSQGDRIDQEALASLLKQPATAVIVQHPNFFGQLEPVFDLAEQAHAAGALLIASVYPISCGVLAPPGEYGADIACGEGQSLGLPLAYGGPYFGFLATRQKYVRQMPGRLIGQTKDVEGRTGYVLTLQTREQHIRREKSTSNICTNQFLCALAASIYLAAMGKQGLPEVARQCVRKSHELRDRLVELEGVEQRGNGPFFNEFVIATPLPAREVLEGLRREGIVGGYPLGCCDPQREKEFLVCVTETRSRQERERYVETLRALLSR